MNQVAQYGQIKIDQFSVNFNLTEKMQETVGKWLQAKRKEKGLNQTELAERARVSKNYISLLEAGKVSQPRLYQTSFDQI